MLAFYAGTAYRRIEFVILATILFLLALGPLMLGIIHVSAVVILPTLFAAFLICGAKVNVLSSVTSRYTGFFSIIVCLFTSNSILSDLFHLKKTTVCAFVAQFTGDFLFLFTYLLEDYVDMSHQQLLASDSDGQPAIVC